MSITSDARRSQNGAWGGSELKCFANWNDGRPETELNFKFYRQATNKIVGHLGCGGGHSSTSFFSDCTSVLSGQGVKACHLALEANKL